MPPGPWSCRLAPSPRGRRPASSPEQPAWAFYAYIQGCGLYYPFPPDDPIWEDAVDAALRLAGLVTE